jgi:hypothetical protein
MPVFFGLLALIQSPNGLNMTRLSSTFAVVEGLIEAMAHLMKLNEFGANQ